MLQLNETVGAKIIISKGEQNQKPSTSVLDQEHFCLDS
jgi:hypothetical protein